MRIANDRPSQRILEVGVGTGLSLPYFRSDARVTGIDVSAEMLDKARRRVERRKLKQVEALLEMDAENMIFEDNSFDAVLGALRRLGGAEPDALCRGDAARLPARRHHRRRQSLHQREPGDALHREAAGAARRQDRLPRRFPARHLPRRQPSCRCARCGRAISSAIGACCAASTRSRPDRPAAAPSATDQHFAACRSCIAEEIVLVGLGPAFGIAQIAAVALGDIEDCRTFRADEARDQLAEARRAEIVQRTSAAQIIVALADRPVGRLGDDDDLGGAGLVGNQRLAP